MRKVKRYQDGGLTVSGSPMEAFQQVNKAPLPGGSGSAPIIQINTPDAFASEGSPILDAPVGMKKGGKVKAKTTYRKGADGCAQRGKTKGRMI
jgi:hypothetical protein